MTRAEPTIADAATGDAVGRLLAARVPAGHWEGHLSSSALSTATATFALSLVLRAGAIPAPGARELIDAGLAWLVRTQNPDGGWGDSTRSLSNISTTALCWAALTVGGPEVRRANIAAEAWLTKAAGSLAAAALARAIAARYGKDRTFSVPILTMCALAGRLGAGRAAWRHVPQLPFELAACPQAWFRWMRLPVVSYALPALIAIGHARHRNRPTRNPVARAARRLAHGRTLHVLRAIQPRGGGFLEATPLTSFVTMSLAADGRAASRPVVAEAVDFLTRSARPDGSWPIDTNLATWLTTLSVNALAAANGLDALTANERAAIRAWLLGQQYRARHPYTGAPPGGWAWTDLPGGVPDADDTAGALLALHHLGADDPAARDAAAAGVRWLLGLQNRDGGVPTFCRGWGNLPFDRSGADLTAHALAAWAAWRDRLPAPLAADVDAATARALRYLQTQQRPDGSWVPLWFGNQFATDDENPTYGTARVVAALATVPTADVGMVDRGIARLLAAQHDDGGWGGAAGVEPSVEETGLAVTALLAAAAIRPVDSELAPAIAKGRRWLAGHAPTAEPQPIGFYFAKLWYFEQLYPLIFAAGATGPRTGAVGSH